MMITLKRREFIQLTSSLVAGSTIFGAGTAFGSVLATTSTFSLVDCKRASLIISADAWDSHAKIQYLGSKSDGYGGDVDATPFDAGIHAIAARSTTRVRIDTTNPAFDSGYGAVRVTSVASNGVLSPKPLMVHTSLNAPRDINVVSGDEFLGGRFRIPVVPPPPRDPTQRFRIAMTGVGPSQIVKVMAPGQSISASFTIASGHTFLWDSEEQAGVDLNQPGIVDIESQGGQIVVSAAIVRGSKQFHLYPIELS